MATGDSILDVRLVEAFARGHVAGAVNIPLAGLAGRMQELPPKGSSLCVYHDDSHVAEQAAELLRLRGYKVDVLDAGMPLNELGPSRGCLWRPSPFLVQAWRQIRAQLAMPIRVVDLGCGSGREAVWLAMQGCQVTAVDVLPDALEKARDLAGNAGVTIETVCHDVARGAFSVAEYDLTCIFRFVDRPLIRRVARELHAGAFVVVEAFHVRDAQTGRTGRDRGKLMADGELASLLEGMEIVVACDAVERDGRWFSQAVGRVR